MNALLAKLKEAPAKKRKETPRAEIDSGKLVRIAGYDRDVAIVVAARYWRLLDRRAKGLMAQLDAVKGVIRAAGVEAMGAEPGVYYGGAKVGGVTVTRANKYQALPPEVSRDELIAMIGGSEYAVSFKEEASIVFKSISHMRQHLGACDLAGVEVDGDVRECIKPKPCIAEKLVELEGFLGQEQMEVLRECAKDQAPAVGRER